MRLCPRRERMEQWLPPWLRCLDSAARPARPCHPFRVSQSTAPGGGCRFLPSCGKCWCPKGSIPDDRRSAYAARVTGHPVTTTDPSASVALPTAWPEPSCAARAVPTLGDLGGDPIEPVAARARAERWAYRELPAPHDPQVFDPHGIAAILEPSARPVVATGEVRSEPRAPTRSTRLRHRCGAR